MTTNCFGAPAMGAPATTIRDHREFLHIDMNQLARTITLIPNDWFPVGGAITVVESATPPPPKIACTIDDESPTSWAM